MKMKFKKKEELVQKEAKIVQTGVELVLEENSVQLGTKRTN